MSEVIEREATQLTVAQRAQVALKAEARKAQFVALAAESKEITAITNPAGYTQCHAARMRLKAARVELTKEGKEVRDDAVKFQKGVIALEKELVDLIEPEEKRLEAIQTEHDTRVERERAEAEAKEQARLASIRDGLADISNKPGLCVGQSSAKIKIALQEMTNQDVTTWAHEFLPEAEAAKAKAIAAMELMLSGTLAQEKAVAEENERIAAEREELARLRAEQDEHNHTEQARIAEETKRRAQEEAAARAKIEAEQRASRERIEAEDRKARLAREEADRKAAEERETKLAEIRAREEAEQERLRTIREAEDKARAEKEAAERAERAAQEAEAAKVAAEQAERDRALRAEEARLAEEKAEIEREQEKILAIDRLIEVLADRIKGRKQYAGIAKAITSYQQKLETQKVAA